MFKDDERRSLTSRLIYCITLCPGEGPMRKDLSMIAVGIDVSKRTLDIQYGAQKQPRFRLHCPNDAAGFEQINHWLERFGTPHQQIHVALEATNTYSDGIAQFLFEQGYQVSVINPARIARFRKAEPVHGKTDRLDAWILARYVEQKSPDAWIPFEPHQQALQVLVQRLEDVQKMIRQERNRLGNQRLTPVAIKSIQDTLTFLQEQECTLKQAIQDQVEQHEDLAQKQQYLISIIGIGKLTAARILSVIGPLDRFHSARQLAAFVGVVPHPYVSGTSVKHTDQIDHRGSPQLRNWLYMCALTSKRWDPAMKAWAQQLQARGQKNKQTIVAVMRKLVHLIYGVLTHEEPYDRSKAFPGWTPAASTTEQQAA